MLICVVVDLLQLEQEATVPSRLMAAVPNITPLVRDDDYDDDDYGPYHPNTLRGS